MQGAYVRIQMISMLLWLSFGHGCGDLSTNAPTSNLSDIYLEDSASNDRRHAATDLERKWAVDMGDCSGVLLNEKYLMSSSHCIVKVGDNARTRFGLGLNNNTIKITRIAEENTSPTLDYRIMEIQWLDVNAPKERNYPKTVAAGEDKVLMSRMAGQGDAIFTVGMATDTLTVQPIFSKGRLKKFENGLLYFNAGVINGNSGGGLMNAEGTMLVGLVKGGPHNKGEKGWNNQSAESEIAWNYAIPMWSIFQESPLLKEAFPEAMVPEETYTKTGEEKIFIALQPVKAGEVAFWASSPQGTRLFMCLDKEGSCEVNDRLAVWGEYRQTVAGNRGIQLFGAGVKALDGRKITFSAYTPANELVVSRTITLKSKGAK